MNKSFEEKAIRGVDRMIENEEHLIRKNPGSLISSLRPLYYCGVGLSLGYFLDFGVEESRLESVVDGFFIGFGYMVVDDLFRRPLNKMDFKEGCILYLGSIVGQVLRNVN